MKSWLTIFLILSFAVAAVGQTKESVPTKPAKESKARSEAEEAFTDFDLGKISINPNNLTRKNIEDLRANFPDDVKPYLIDEGEYVARLARIAEPIFRFHKARKSRTAVFEHERPTVFTWKETFVTFSRFRKTGGCLPPERD